MVFKTSPYSTEPAGSEPKTQILSNEGEFQGIPRYDRYCTMKNVLFCVLNNYKFDQNAIQNL